MKQLSSLLKISVSTFFLLLQITAKAGIPYGIRSGAAEAGMGHACVMKTGFWSSFRNQALLAFNKEYSVALDYENRFGIQELGTRTAGILIPAGKASAGAAYSHFGYADFKRDAAGIACGLKLSEKLAAGVQVDYFSEKTYGEYSKRQFITFEAGLIASVSEKIMLGVHIFNPVPNSLRKNDQPLTVSAGAGIELKKDLFAGVEGDMSTGSKLTLRTGFEYEALRDLRLRAGFCSLNNSFSFGLGYRFRFAGMDLGFATHDRLGVTSSVSLIFKIR